MDIDVVQCLNKYLDVLKFQIYPSHKRLQLKNEEKLKYWLGLGQDFENLYIILFFTCVMTKMEYQKPCLELVSDAVELKKKMIFFTK